MDGFNIAVRSSVALVTRRRSNNESVELTGARLTDSVGEDARPDGARSSSSCVASAIDHNYSIAVASDCDRDSHPGRQSVGC